MTARGSAILATLFRSRTTLRSAILVVSLLAAPRASRAQVADSVHIPFGTPVRVRTRDGKEGKWRFIRASPEGLMLTQRSHGGQLQRIVPWTEAERVDTVAVGQPSGRRMLAGGVAGGFFGVLAVVFAAGAGGPCHGDAGSCPGFAAIVYAPEIIGAGFMTGAYLGLRRRPWHWSTAWRALGATTPEVR